jgi:hypothetical protein
MSRFPSTLRTLAATALAVGGLGAAAVAVGAGPAGATSGPFTWCPGQSMERPDGPNWFGKQYQWDMNVCHTWYRVSYGYGNVVWAEDDIRTVQGSDVWDGDNPPPGPDMNCGLFFCPVPPHPDPNFHGFGS